MEISSDVLALYFLTRGGAVVPDVTVDDCVFVGLDGPSYIAQGRGLLRLSWPLAQHK